MELLALYHLMVDQRHPATGTMAPAYRRFTDKDQVITAIRDLEDPR